ncbi:hypothetical protein CPB83DRAFT_66834 [Crepidotus variabilis]|uniref:Uncharacterized protein n=1 Tax=Crepidotus variabilis TaxID=179855 RepID=A0A9P6E5T7_9AGAR|nr:hypothetical protein CPB83DRAFT_66834 [Crepidotus variabilis]
MNEQRTQIPNMKTEVQMQLNQYKLEALTSSNTHQLIPSRSSTLDSLTYQLENLYVDLPKVAAQHKSNEKQPPVHPLIVRVPYFSFHRSRAQRNRRLLRKVLDLLENLEDDATAIEQHAFGLNLLVDYFGQSDMCGESLQVAVWVVDIYRILVRVNRTAFEPFLAKALGNLVHCRVVMGLSFAESLSTIDEAITLIRPHANPNPIHSYDTTSHGSWLPVHGPSGGTGIKERKH